MRQPLFGEALEHRIVVGCFFRDILDDIPVFYDFAVFDAENVDSSLTTVCFIEFDVIVDASDNFPTRYLLSDTCMKLGKPDVYGAICEFAGQVTVFASDGPCLRCLCPEAEDPSGNPNSAAYGVLGVIPGMIGCMQAAEVFLTGKNSAVQDELKQVKLKLGSPGVSERTARLIIKTADEGVSYNRANQSSYK